MTATLYKTDGTQAPVAPAAGACFSLEELQGFVGGYIQLCPMPDGRIMVVNDDGYSDGLPVNDYATLAALHLAQGPRGIVGDVLICDAGMID